MIGADHRQMLMRLFLNRAYRRYHPYSNLSAPTFWQHYSTCTCVYTCRFHSRSEEAKRKYDVAGSGKDPDPLSQLNRETTTLYQLSD
jgi:hypothetical protein